MTAVESVVRSPAVGRRWSSSTVCRQADQS